MKKTLLILLALSIINCENSYDKTTRLIDLVPTNPLLLIKHESVKNYKSDVFYKNFKSIISFNLDSISNKFLENPILISYHNIGKNSLEHILFTDLENVVKLEDGVLEDSINYNGFKIKKLIKNNKSFYSAEKNGIYIESINKLLIENSLRNSNYLSNDLNNDFDKLYNSSSSNISLFISDHLKKYIDIPELSDFFNISDISDWIQFDVDFNQNQLMLNGLSFKKDSIPRKINSLTKIEPTVTNILQIVPNNFIEFERYSYNHSKYLINVEQNNTIDNLKLIKNDSLLYNIFEIGSIVLKKDSISTFSFNNKELLNFKIQQYTESSYTYRNKKIHKLSHPLFNSNTLDNFYKSIDKNYLTILNDILILSKKKTAIETMILNFTNESIIDNSLKFSEIYSKVPKKSNHLKIYNLERFSNDLIKQFGVSKEDFPFWINHLLIDDELIHNTHIIEKSEKKIISSEVSLLFSFKLKSSIHLKPKIVTNYVTKEKEIITQDDLNNLYLISNNGELIWRKQLESKIVGEISQIDLYKNGRLQYVFETENSLMILDKNGNTAKKLNHKKNSNYGLSVFDYDQINNYRFLTDIEGRIEMFDEKFNKVKGFNKNNIKSQITNPSKHFRIGSKDYLIINTKKRLYITDRRGNIRVKVPENLNVSTKEVFINQNSFVTIDKSNNLVRITVNGKILKKPLPLETPYLITANNNILVTISENILTINDNVRELPFGNYTNPKILTGKKQDYISITDKDQDQIYIFDSKSKLISGFPVFGTSSIDFYMNRKEKKIITSLGELNEILVYSIN
ncbi:MAG: hypothetical protein ACKVJS_04765 [Flavobacteriales bacterium]|tara:strand:+ start:3922 stop:6312 length:2391 start_codon:yes stop_codon:yes gene_type:complete